MVYVPLGLAYIAAVLEQAGYSVEIIDLNVGKASDKDLQRKIRNADIVGITGMITEYGEVLRLVDIAKKANPKARVVLGGPLATTLPQELLRVSVADLVVVGEGEKTIINLVSAIKYGDSFGDIKGIVYRDGNQIIATESAEPIADLDTLPFPARHLLNMNKYLKDLESCGLKNNEFGKTKSTNLITSRGCPYSCTFCFKDMWGHKWRGRSPANIVDEMELLYRRYGMNSFFFNDDTFVLDRKRVFELCELIREKRLDVVWNCNGRVDLMTKELLEAMYDAGCRGIGYGIESGDQEILDSMKKNITLDQVREVVKWTRNAGIKTLGTFIIGMLGETKATIKETMAFARELNLDSYNFSVATPLTGTELYKSAHEAGLIQEDKTCFKRWSLYVNANLTRDCSDADLAAFANEAFKEFFLKKTFGKHYLLNANFFKEGARALLSLRSKDQAKELANKAGSVISSHFRKA